MSDNYNKRNELTEDEMRIENEILSMKIQAEFGGECHFLNEELPPEVQHHFLRTVYEFQQQLDSNDDPVSLFQQLGEPVFRPCEELSNDEVEEELQRLHDLLFMNQFVVDSVFQYPPEEIYRFITEELFQEEVQSFSMPGFFRHYCYEDYHPNPEAELKRTITQVLNELFAKRLSTMYAQFDNRLKTPDGDPMDPEILEDAFKKFYQRFDGARLKSLKFEKMEIDGCRATVTCAGVYELQKDNRSEREEFAAAFELVKEMDILWIFEKVRMSCLEL